MVQLTVRSILKYVTKSATSNSILGICLPIPRVCTSLDLLCAPSPLVVYAATETEYKVSGFRPPIISSYGGNVAVKYDKLAGFNHKQTFLLRNITKLMQIFITLSVMDVFC